MTPNEAKKLCAVALAATPDRASFLDATLVAAMQDAWVLLLEDLTYAEGSAALKRYLATSPGKLPAPGHLRQIASEAAHGRTRSGAAAWEDVRRAIGAVGRYREPTFADPVTASVVRGLGWRELCDSENATADRARFIDAYETHAADAAQDRSVATLPGVARPALSSGQSSLGSLLGDVLRELPGGS